MSPSRRYVSMHWVDAAVYEIVSMGDDQATVMEVPGWGEERERVCVSIVPQRVPAYLLFAV